MDENPQMMKTLFLLVSKSNIQQLLNKKTSEPYQVFGRDHNSVALGDFICSMFYLNPFNHVDLKNERVMVQLNGSSHILSDKNASIGDNETISLVR